MMSASLEIILNKAIKLANERKHEFLTIESVLKCMLADDVVAEVLGACQVDISKLQDDLDDFLDQSEHFSILSDDEIEDLGKRQFVNERLKEIAKENGIRYQPEISPALQRVIQRAALHVQSSGKKNITAVNILVAVFSEKESHGVFFLEKHGVTRLQVVEKIAHNPNLNSSSDQGHASATSTDSQGRKLEKYEKALKDYTINLNERAKEGKIDPVVGRKAEIERTIQILARRRKNNPLLVGDAGVGKTAIAEGLAQRIVDEQVPEHMKNFVVYALDMASLLAGTKFRGDFEERLKIVIEAIKDSGKENKKNILFIDEIHTIIGAGSTSGGSLDASNLLKPALSRGDISCLGSTTFDEYRKFFEKDHALNRRFQKIDILEPSEEDTIKILMGLKDKFEQFHQVSFSPEVIASAVKLSIKHLNDRKLPDKAIDVIDEAAAALKLSNLKQSHVEANEVPSSSRSSVEVEDIEKVIAQMARIPEKSVNSNEREKLKNLKRDLKLLIFGQDDAIEKVSNAIILSRSGLRDETKPIASFLFTGPTGVGKTELAKQLASTLGIFFHRIDMSEFMEKHSVAKLIGSPPGYVGYDQGGVLTETINKNPYAVLLLDEIEKAHFDVFNVLLQIMDHGNLTDSNGRSVNFKNVVLIMTSNVGAKELEFGTIGLGTQTFQLNSSKRDQAIKHVFTPEFRNRIDAIVHFNKLQRKQVVLVVEKFMMELDHQLMNQGIELVVEPGLIEWLAEQGYDEKLGARPLARVINEKIKKPLAHEILFGELTDQQAKVRISIDKDKVKFSFESHKHPSHSSIS